MLFAGCGSTASETAEQMKQEDQQKPEVKSEAKSEEEPEQKQSADSNIRSFAAGDWTLFDRTSGEDFGTLSIGRDGSFEFVRIADGAKGSGKITFDRRWAKEDEKPDGFEMTFDDCKDLVPEGLELYGDDGTSGIFHFGTFGNEDYLYLKEIGNGDSIVSVYIFNTNPESEEIGDWSYDWLLYRDGNGADTSDAVRDDTFYAWAWEIDDDGEGVWLQPMNEHEFETFEDYSNRKFTGGYFTETDDISVAYYGMTDNTDLSGLVNTADWDSGYPLMMCELTTDAKGNIVRLRDVDIAMYDVYDMGELEPAFSYTGTTFTVEGYDIDVREAAPAATAIMDAKHVGDWIIVECHNNPNISTYLFYNINNGLMDYFEYGIDGANLIWQGDDLSTAVYQRYNDIYDFWGHHIGGVQDGELYELAFKDSSTITAKCWRIDEAGNEEEFTEEFEYEPYDSAILKYYEYMLGGARQWRRLMEEAGDAKALVIINPFEKMLERMPYSVDFEHGALDKVAVIPLVDDATVSVRSLMPGSGTTGRTEEAQKGSAVVIDATVSEGLPASVITVSAPGVKKCEWEVVMLSGRIPQKSEFIK